MALLISASASLALSNCPSDQTKRYHNCFGTYNYSDGRKYVGEWANDSWHGRGTATFSDGHTKKSLAKIDKCPLLCYLSNIRGLCLSATTARDSLSFWALKYKVKPKF